MSEIEHYQSGPANEQQQQQGPEGLLFTGDYIRGLSPDQIVAIGDFASRMFGVEMRQLDEAAITALPEEGPLPVPATVDDFLSFAEQQQYTRRMAFRAWNSAQYTCNRGDQDGLPAVQRSIDYETVDLRSIQERLAASNFSPKAWTKAGVGIVKFLTGISSQT